MWTVPVQVVLVLTQYYAGVLLVVDQHLVGALSPDVPDEAFANVFARSVLGGVFTTSMPSAMSTASKDRCTSSPGPESGTGTP
jgi:hypothetical protein